MYFNKATYDPFVLSGGLNRVSILFETATSNAAPAIISRVIFRMKLSTNLTSFSDPWKFSNIFVEMELC